MRKHDLARKFERQLAEDLGGRRIFASGAGFEKADVRVRQTYKTLETGIAPTGELALRIEAKTTSRGVYAFKVQDWADIASSAMQHGENPVFAIHFVGARYSCVLITSGFALQLGLKQTEELPKDINRSWTISYTDLLHKRQRTFVRCQLKHRAELLVLLPYDDFLPAVKNYAPDGE